MVSRIFGSRSRKKTQKVTNLKVLAKNIRDKSALKKRLLEILNDGKEDGDLRATIEADKHYLGKLDLSKTEYEKAVANVEHGGLLAICLTRVRSEKKIRVGDFREILLRAIEQIPEIIEIDKKVDRGRLLELKEQLERELEGYRSVHSGNMETFSPYFLEYANTLHQNVSSSFLGEHEKTHSKRMTGIIKFIQGRSKKVA